MEIWGRQIPRSVLVRAAVLAALLGGGVLWVAGTGQEPTAVTVPTAVTTTVPVTGTGSSPSTVTPSTPTTRPNLTPGDTTAVPVLTAGPASLHLDAPLLTMGKQITAAYSTSVAASGSTVTVDGSMLPFFVGYRSDSAWLTVQSSMVADLPFLAVPDAIAIRSAATKGDPIDWAKGDDGVDSAQVLQSNVLELVIRAKGLSDADFVSVLSSLRAAPRPISVADMQGVLQHLHLSTVVTLEGTDAVDGVTYGLVQGGTVYGTTAGPVVVRASSATTTDLRYLDLVAAVEATAAETGLKVVLEGYPPPRDARLKVLQVTPDPGVIEVNIHPAVGWNNLVEIPETIRSIGMRE